MDPIKPMLANRVSLKTIKLNGDKFWADVKYDGERVQIHKRAFGEYKFFSRSLKEIPKKKIGDVVDALDDAFAAQTFVMDAELVLVSADGDVLPFGSLGVKRRIDYAGATTCLILFDCMLYNDVQMMDFGYAKRREFLRSQMSAIPNRIVLAKSTPFETVDELSQISYELFHKTGMEGLVIKKDDSKYEPGKRRWLKIKRDDLGLIDTVDLVTMCGRTGTGKNAHRVCRFDMGALDDDGTLVKVCTVFSGHADADIEELQRSLQLRELRSGVYGIENPQVWELQGSEITASTRRGLSIRFPRVVRHRPDKRSYDATTLHQLREMLNIGTTAL